MNTVINQVQDQVYFQIWDKVYGPAKHEMFDLVTNQVYDDVRREVDQRVGQVRIQVLNKVWHEASAEP
jgi:hypothetical protein